MENIYGYTEDNLKLMGCLWSSGRKETCIVFIHGQGQNIMENEFATIWGNLCLESNVGFLYGHNRGYSQFNDIRNKNGDMLRYGTTYEIFEESLYDVHLWINEAKKLGYKKIILLGHSLGCNKAIYYLSKNVNMVNALVLASPPDMVGITKIEEKNFESLMKEALNNIKNNNKRKLLPEMIGDWGYQSSENFVNFYTEGNAIDNIPIERNPKHFEQLEKINIPILSFVGGNEYPTYLKFEILKDKALACSSFETKVFEETNHFYQGKEKETIEYILSWVKKLKR